MDFPGQALPAWAVGAADSLHAQYPCTNCVPRDMLAPSLLVGLLLLWERLSLGRMWLCWPTLSLVQQCRGLEQTAARELLLQSREEQQSLGEACTGFAVS